MAEDKRTIDSKLVNYKVHQRNMYDHWKKMINGGIRKGILAQNPYLVAVDPYDAPVEEEKPEPIDMTQYIHKDEMVQILLDSRHALFTDKIPSVLEVIEWIEERKKQQL